MANHQYMQAASDNVVRVLDAVEVISSVPITNATVSVTITDCEGNPIPGVTWPVTGSFVPNTDADYAAIIPKELDVKAGDMVKAIVAFDGGPGFYQQWEIPIIVTT